MAAAKKTDVQITMTLKPSEVSEAILGMRKTKRATFVWGPPGISKSAVSQQVATMLGIAFIDVRLSQMDPTDLRGIPYPVNEGGVQGIAWSAPLVLPRNLDLQSVVDVEAVETVVAFYNPKGVNGIHYCTDPQIKVQSLTPGADAILLKVSGNRFVVALTNGDKHGDNSPVLVPGKVSYTVSGDVHAILGLEEFNSAPPSVQAAAYQLILDRRLGDYEVPDGVYMLAMGNRDTDKGVTFKMPTPIMNRFVHIEMKSDTDDWIIWALEQQIHPEVVGYISAFKEQLFDFKPGTAARGFQTPRSWHFVSDILKENGESLPYNVLNGLVIGAIGDGAGIQFMEFRKIASDLPNPEDVLSGKLTKMPKEVEVSLAYALTTTLCYRLKNSVDEIMVKYRSDKAAVKKSPEFTKWLGESDNFLAFIMANFKPEISIMGAKAALSVHRLPFDAQRMKHFELFANRFKGLIL